MIYQNAVNNKENVKIIVSQPRKLAAITNAQRVASEINCNVGEIVGYQIGLDKKVSTTDEKSKIIFVTTGVLLEKLIAAKDANNFSHIILDEVHEREIDMDLTLAIIREFIHHNSSVKVILMSATMQVDTFHKFFNNEFHESPINPGIIKIDEKLKFNVEIKYLEDIKFASCQNEYKIARKIIKEIIKNYTDPTKTILVFLPGLYEIHQMKDELEDCDEIKDSCMIAILHSSINTANQKLAFRTVDKRKIVLSTNIAESSVTIPNVDVVMDFCLTKYIVIDEKTKFSNLAVAWASKDNLQQRAGRTGRTCDGKVYRLITKMQYNCLKPNQTPEILRSPLERVVLRVKKLNFLTVETMIKKCPDPPKESAINLAILNLRELGALFQTDGNVTFFGEIMSVLPLDVRFSKLICLGFLYSVLNETIIIAAGLSVRGIFLNELDENVLQYESRLKWADGSSCDFIAILNAYNTWKNKIEQGHFRNQKKLEADWCRSQNLDIRSVNEMHRLIKEIEQRLEEKDVRQIQGEVWKEEEKMLIVKVVISGAFFPNYFIVGTNSEWKERKSHKEVMALNPQNTIYFQRFDRDLVPELYEEEVKELMIMSGIAKRSGDMKLTFDKLAHKVYIEFISDESKIDKGQKSGELSPLVSGMVPLEMYLAAYAAKLNFRFNLRVLRRSEALRIVADKRLDGDMYFDVKPNYMKHPELCALPASNITELTGYISNVIHPQKFFVMLHNEILHKIESFLDTFENYTNYNDIKDIRERDMVVVKANDLLYRAKVLQIYSKKNQVKVRLVDYGMDEILKFEEVYKFQEEFKEIFEIPERSFEARLSHIAPSLVKCPRERWTTEAIDTFKKMYSSTEYDYTKPLKMEIYSVDNDIVTMKIKKQAIKVETTQGDKIIEIEDAAELLIKNKFAIPVEEPYSSRFRHQRRVDQPEWTPNEEFARRINTLDEYQFPKIPKTHCTEFVKLKGPQLSIISDIDGLFSNKEYSSFSTSPQSVNSILFKSTMTNYSGNLLVAANIQSSNNKSILHATSMMPNIPGFAVLMTLIFAPKVYFEANKDGTRIINVYAGLGWDINRKSLHPEHEIVVPVDIELASEDIKTINIIRYFMSDIINNFERETKCTDEFKINTLHKIKFHMNQILVKQRSRVAIIRSSGRPVQVPEIKDHFEGRGVYSSIQNVVLKPPSDEYTNKIKKKLKDMYENSSIMR
jgi:ATP-dependent RNA helicase TDRD9